MLFSKLSVAATLLVGTLAAPLPSEDTTNTAILEYSLSKRASALDRREITGADGVKYSIIAYAPRDERNEGDKTGKNVVPEEIYARVARDAVARRAEQGGSRGGGYGIIEYSIGKREGSGDYGVVEYSAGRRDEGEGYGIIEYSVGKE